MTDQVSYALANFVGSFLLARFLPPFDYGVFSVVNAIYLLLGTIHLSLLIEPMLVFGAAKDPAALQPYARMLVRLHLVLTGATSLALVAVGMLFVVWGSPAFGHVQIALALVLPALLLLILLRRMAYLWGDEMKAAIGGLIYLALSTSLLVWAYNLNRLSVVVVFWIMGGVSLLVALGLWNWFRLTKESVGAADPVWREHWQFGRWALPANLLAWLPWNLPLVLLSVLASVEASAALRAIINLIMPIQQLNAAINTAIVPVFSRQKQAPHFQHTVRSTLVALVVGVVLYWIGLGLLNRPIVDYAYAGRFVEHSKLLWLVGALPVILAFIVVSSSVLRASERVKEVFIAYLVGGLSVVSLGLALVWQFKLLGAALAMLLSHALIALILQRYAHSSLNAKGGLA
jgi:O-antigen/teichoic acid export membrane protein